VPADGHRLGERGVFGGQSVRDGQGEGLFDDELFGVGAGGFGAEPDGMDRPSVSIRVYPQAE
jgi:hypothetical protein